MVNITILQDITELVSGETYHVHVQTQYHKHVNLSKLVCNCNAIPVKITLFFEYVCIYAVDHI